MGYTASLIIPIFMLALIYILFAFIRHKQPGNMSLELFILTGITGWLVFLNSMTASIRSIRKGDKLSIHQVVSFFDIKIANLLLDVFPVVMLGIFLGAGLYLFHFDITINNFLILAFSLFLAAMFGYSVGVIIGVLSLIAEAVLTAQMLIKRGLFFFSGVFYSIDELPEQLKAIVQYVPLAHVIEGIRYSLSSTYPAAEMSLEYAFLSILGVLFFSVLLEVKFRDLREI